MRLDADDPFMLGLMGEHGRASDIADRIEPGNIGAPATVRGNNSMFDFDAERLKPEIFDIACDADSRDQALRLHSPRHAIGIFQRGGNAVLLFLDPCHFGRGQNFDALLFKPFAGMGGDLRVLGRQDLRQDFDDRHTARPRCDRKKRIRSRSRPNP